MGEFGSPKSSSSVALCEVNEDCPKPTCADVPAFDGFTDCGDGGTGFFHCCPPGYACGGFGECIDEFGNTIGAFFPGDVREPLCCEGECVVVVFGNGCPP